MSTKQEVTISWRAGMEYGKALGTTLEKQKDRLGKVLFSYLEWRPGTGLMKPDARPARILIEGPPTDPPGLAIDELRLFGENSGLHAIEDAGTTRWMQWQLGSAPNPDSAGNWEEVKAEATTYPILMLDEAGASRFGIHANLPVDKTLMVVEYRVGGTLFCWDLQRRKAA